MARKGPVADKDLKVFSVDQYPYMVVKKYGSPRYFRSFREARESMLADMDALEHSLVVRLQDSQAAEAIAACRYLVERMPSDGALISQVVDPYSGVRYQAKLVNRAKDTLP